MIESTERTEPPGLNFVRMTGHAFCKHYSGVNSNRVCAAGVTYRDVAVNNRGQASLRATDAANYPCSPHNSSFDSCPLRQLVWPEELPSEEDRMDT